MDDRLGLPPVAVRRQQGSAGPGANTTPVTRPAILFLVAGTGSFRPVEWSRDSFLRLGRFDRDFLRGQPFLDEVVLRFVPAK